MPGLETLPPRQAHPETVPPADEPLPEVFNNPDLQELAQQAAAEIAPPTDDTPEQIRVVLTSLDSNVDAFAREAAHEKLAKKHQGPLWKRMAKSAWHNITREYQVVKGTKEAREEILESGNLRHHQGESDEEWRSATIRRYASEYGEALVHEEAGETYHKLSAENEDQNATRIRNDVLGLVRQYANGDVLDDASLEAMQGRLAEAWRDEGVGQDYIGEGHLLAHNIADMARQVKAALDAREGLDAVDRELALDEMLANAEVITGEAKVGSRVEIESTVSERLARKLQNVPFVSEGRLAGVTSVVSNELVVAAMLSAATGVGKRAASKLGAIVVPGLGAGVVAGLRERRAMRDERALAGRRLDVGQGPEGGNKAQAEVDATMYASRGAGELLGELGSLYDDEGKLGISDREGLERAMQIQAEIRARMEISDREGVRLINFADISPEQMESQRFDLDLAMAKLQVDLGNVFGDPEAAAAWAEAEKSTMVGALQGEMKAKDRLFHKLVAKRALKRAVATTLVGGVVGLGIKEGIEGIHHVGEYASSLMHAHSEGSPDMSMISHSGDVTEHIGARGPAVPDHIGADAGHDVPDHVGAHGPSVPDHVGGRGPAVPDHIGARGPAVPEHIGGGAHVGETTVISENAKFNVPEGFQVQHQGDHLLVQSPDGKNLDLLLNQDGTLSNEARERLTGAGLNLVDHQEIVPGAPNVSQVEVSTTDFVQAHKGDMTEVHRTMWYDNNTRKFDLNELGLHNQVAPEGNIVVNVQSMTSGGSLHGASGVNWHEAAAQGHLSVFVSASEGTQSHAFEIPVRPDGTAIIEKGSPAAALFNSEGKFIGGFQEVAVKGDVLPNGQVNIATLATVVGEHSPTVTDTVTTPTFATAHSYSVLSMQGTFSTGPAPNPLIFTTTAGARRQFGEAGATPQEAVLPEGGLIAPEAPPEPEPLALEPAPSAGAPELSAAPDPEAERRADEFGLPSANAADTSQEPSAIGAGGRNEANAGNAGDGGGAEAAGADTGPNAADQPDGGGTDAGPNQAETEGEVPGAKEGGQMIQEIMADDRDLPPGYKMDVTPESLAGKFVIRAVHEMMKKSPRNRGETTEAYRYRIVNQVHDGATNGISRLPRMPLGVRRVLSVGFTAARGLKMEAVTRSSERNGPSASAA